MFVYLPYQFELGHMSTATATMTKKTIADYSGTELINPGHFVPARTWATLKIGTSHAVYIYTFVGRFTALLFAKDGRSAVAQLANKTEAECLLWANVKVKELKEAGAVKTSGWPTWLPAPAQEFAFAANKKVMDGNWSDFYSWIITCKKWGLVRIGDKEAAYVFRRSDYPKERTGTLKWKWKAFYLSNLSSGKGAITDYAEDDDQLHAKLEAMKATEAKQKAADDERKAAKARRHTLKVGGVLVHSFGYSMTLVDFYEITKVDLKTRKVELVELRQVDEKGGGCGFMGNALPVRGSRYGKILSGTADGNNVVSLGPGKKAGLWDGKARYYNRMD